jgi:hypothetical protein
MKSSRPIQSLLVLWALWEFVNAALSTFAGPLGASFVGWVPHGGWTSDLYSMSQQYGMVLLLLGAVYLLTATDPVRFRSFIWIPIAEQVVGIAYALYGLVGGHMMTGGQFTTQIIINIVVAALFYLLRPSSTGTTGELRQAKA